MDKEKTIVIDFMDGKWHRYVFVDEIDELLKEYENEKEN